ncbi:hypothetical protein EDB85DRAFT_1897514 [Lactarius pseudohatsudake]|nr:hypothetical protein EDB85DRAFT_1897514 [Lactarius pseudohatsudake]
MRKARQLGNENYGPPLTLYRDCRPGAYSDLIFGVPLVDLEIKVPKVRPEYSEYIFVSQGGSVYDDAEVLEANDFSLLRSKIRHGKLHPVQKTSLRAFLQHLLRVATHSDKNAMTARVLATLFKYHVLRGNEVLQDGFLGGIPTSAQPSFPSLPTPLLNPLLGLPSSQQTLTEMTAREPVTPEVRGTKATEILAKSPPAEVVSVPPTSVAEWWLRLLPPQPEPLTIPQGPRESMPCTASDLPISSTTGLQTRVGRFSS